MTRISAVKQLPELGAQDGRAKSWKLGLDLTLRGAHLGQFLAVASAQRTNNPLGSSQITAVSAEFALELGQTAGPKQAANFGEPVTSFYESEAC